MTDQNENFGLWLKETRKAKGLTQQQLSNAVGCTHANISRIERGESNAGNVLKKAISSFFENRSDIPVTHPTKTESMEFPVRAYFRTLVIQEIQDSCVGLSVDIPTDNLLDQSDDELIATAKLVRSSLEIRAAREILAVGCEFHRKRLAVRRGDGGKEEQT